MDKIKPTGLIAHTPEVGTGLLDACRSALSRVLGINVDTASVFVADYLAETNVTVAINIHVPAKDVPKPLLYLDPLVNALELFMGSSSYEVGVTLCDGDQLVRSHVVKINSYSD